MLTYSWIVPILIIKDEKLASLELLKKMLVFLYILYCVEAVWGFIHALYGFTQTGSFGASNGDYVEGTIGPALHSDLAFSNVMFSANMVFILILLFILEFIFNYGIKRWLFFGLLVIILASVVHQLFFLVFALIFAYTFIKPKIVILNEISRKRIKRTVIALIVFGTLSAGYFIGGNISHVYLFAQGLYLGNYPRSIATINTVVDLPKFVPEAPLIGLGPGQFCSRASLIGSGYYLGGFNNPRAAPFLDKKVNKFADKYIVTLMQEWANVDYIGSTHEPYYSILSVYSEMGIVGLALIAFWIIKLILISRKRAVESEFHRFFAFTFLVGCFFLLFLGFQENYYETIQAIFIGVLTLKVIYSNLMYSPDLVNSIKSEAK